MNDTLEKLNRIPYLGRSILPTPLHRLGGLSRDLGIDLWCKRDDMTAFGFGGNKTRKLDYLVAQALNHGATDLIGIGAVQSNFCRMAAAYASVKGLGCTLVLGGTAQRRGTGNHLLSELFGAECTYVESDDWNDWAAAAERVSSHYAARNRVPFLMPVGGSTPTGALGYVRGFFEMMEDFLRADLTPAAIYHATSSAGTHAGLITGKAAHNWHGEIRAVAVAKNKKQLHDETAELASRCGALLDVDVHPESIHVDETHAGAGYAIETDEAREAQELFARREGMVLDMVYTAKAAAGLIADARSGKIPQGACVVFLHTGGSPEVFARSAP
jgi:1-aminocyclopropane-1-carboxylate deaminase/D-cysteine desulfhydrase-like pyridoxal-dependent ACC family enzyme